MRGRLDKVVDHSYTTGKIFILPEYESAFDEPLIPRVLGCSEEFHVRECPSLSRGV
jgi:hypothetical protein